MPGNTQRYPLIFDTANNQLQEIGLTDKLDSSILPQTIPLDNSVTNSKIAQGVSITFASGTTQTPSIRIGTGSTFVGAYSPDNGKSFAIATGGQQRFKIDENGNIDLFDSALPVTNPNWVGAKVNTIYVNPSDLNSTDIWGNDGGNIARPFKTIERALLEAAKKSYVAGNSNNDRFEAYTIMVFPGEYVIDNRPGLASNEVSSQLSYSIISSWTTDEQIRNNIYKFNPVTGGVIVPRGTSIVGYDLRKTVIRPKFVPHPENSNYGETSIFKVTGGCYFWQMTFKDAPTNFNNGTVTWAPGTLVTGETGLDIGDAVEDSSAYSHHKVVCFSYANQTTGTGGELNLYYTKVDNITSELDPREVRLEEYQIVGAGSSRTTIDTVNSASPYIFNCSLRSVLGLCGMNADGDKVKADSFKSMVVAQFTGISLQRDSTAFWQPKTADGVFNETTNPSATFPIYADPDAEYKIKYRHYHIKATNGAFIQIVSVFAVGYADQFIAINGGDMSITNSNSNFGQISLRAVGSGLTAFVPSSLGKITALIPPRGISSNIIDQELYSIDYETTWNKNNQNGSDGKKFNQQNLNTFLTNPNQRFKLYLNVGSLQSENDIPEFIVESPDYSNNGEIERKRYLTFGSNNNFSLFRDYYSYTGTVEPQYASISTTVENEDGTPNLYTARIVLDYEEGIDDSGYGNTERQGYFYDPVVKKVYLKINSIDYSDSRTFLQNYIFAKTTESSLVTETVTNPDQSVQIVTSVKDVQVLAYYTGFPSSLNVRLLSDNRSSTPADLLWRIEYTIPKNVSNIPKPPEKRFIIKAANNRLFQVYDVQEIQAWEKDIKDGIYYLIIIRADVDTFVDWTGNGYLNTPITIVRGAIGSYESYTSLSGMYASSRYGYGSSTVANTYRVSSNINYLYPSTIEECLPHRSSVIWNPVVADSRVLVERIGTGTTGYRTKELSVPNKKYYKKVLTAVTKIEYKNPENIQLLVSNVSVTGTGNSALITLGAGVTHDYSVNDIVYFASSTSNFASSSYRINNVPGNTSFYVATTPEITKSLTGTGNSGYVSNISILLTLESTSGLTAGQTVRLSGLSNKALNNSEYIYSISGNKILITQFGAGVTNPPETETSAAILTSTPFYDSPSLYSITAEAVSGLVTGLGLRYLENPSTGPSTFNTSILKSSSSNIFVSGTTIWNGNSTTYYPYSYYRKIRYGNYNLTTDPNSNSSSYTVTLNSYGIDDTPENRKIICVSNSSTEISANKTNNDPDIIALSPTVPLYRPSIIRASSHTWEYVGLGTGNYSTAFPQVQTRVLKPYEQYIAQGYENSGGFVASSGTNSNGDQYVGNQVIQAGGQSTFTLNVPKIRKTSETNFVDSSNIENRIANSVINVTSTSSKNATAQSLLKGLSNFFNTARLSVSDRANISSLTVSQQFNISNTRISNGINFPEGDTQGYGFVKAAKPEKTGFISTDTNDKLYVSPKYLDAWRAKRGLISENAVQLDNNRIYIQPLAATVLDGSTTNGNVTSSPLALGTGHTIIRVKESNGLPPYGSIDIEMNLPGVNFTDLDNTNSSLNPTIFISLKYDKIDYDTNRIFLSPIQNGISLQSYLNNIIGTGRSVIKDIPSPLSVIENQSVVLDPKYIKTTLTSSFTTPQNGTIGLGGSTLNCSSATVLNFPDRGSLIIRGIGAGNSIFYGRYAYYKFGNNLQVVRRIDGKNDLSDTGEGATFGSGTTVLFGGSTTQVFLSDRWASENPFIPFLENLSEDVDLESATLYEISSKPSSFSGRTNDQITEYIKTKVPNPYSSKANGVNLLNRNAIKRFEPFVSFSQAANYANRLFGNNDNVELLLKPGYYILDNASFNPSVSIKGTGVLRTGGAVGKETASTGAGRIGGYVNTDVKRTDSVYLFRSPSITYNYGNRSNTLSASNSNSLTFNAGFTLENIHILDLNTAIIENEILDSYYSSNTTISSARRRVRRAYNVRLSNNFPSSDSGVAGGLSFNFRTGHTVGTGSTIKMQYWVRHDNVTNSSGAAQAASKTNCRYVRFSLNYNDFNDSSSNIQKYEWAKKYIIPGSMLYFLPSGGSVTSTTDKTRILDVNIVGSGENEYIDFICAVDNSNGLSNSIEDLSISNYNDNSIGKIVVLNKFGDELSVLCFNTALLYRKSLLANNFANFGGVNVTDDVDIFENKITKYDKPEIYGILNGYTKGRIMLVIDRNPSIDKTPSNVLPAFPGADYANNRSVLLKYTNTTTEDFSLNIPYTPSGSPRFGSVTNNRFYFIEILPSQIESFSDNIGIGYTSTVSSFTISNLVDLRTSFTNRNDFIVAAKSNLNVLNCPYKLDNNLVNISGTATYVNSTGILTGTGTSFLSEVKVGDCLYFGTGTTIGIVNTVTSNTELTIRNNSLKYSSNISTGTTIKIDSNNTGKEIYINYPYNYRNLLKHFMMNNSNTFGNLGNSLIRSNNPQGGIYNATIYNVTLGAQSTYDSLNNTFGGSYGGGYFSLANKNLNLQSLRVRGNITLDYTGLFAVGETRSFNNFRYGHSRDLFQIEKQININSLVRGIPPRLLSYSKDDEGYLYVSEFRPESTHHYEPNTTTSGNRVDYDQRVLPISCYAAINRFNSSGSLNTNVSIPERYITPGAGITVGSSSNGFSGWNLTYGTGNSLTFNYTNDDVINNIFSGTYASRIVNPDNIKSTYATVTFVEDNISNSSGNIKTARITYSGTIPSDLSSIKFVSTYLNSERYNYITTATSRYQKTVSGGRSFLRLTSGTNSVTAQSADINITGTGTTALTRRLVSFGSGGSAYIETNSSGSIISFDPVSYGTGLSEGQILSINEVGAGLSNFSITVQRSLNENISIFNPGEYIVIPPQNCFILNNISSFDVNAIKSSLQRAKEIFKPGDYILLGNIYYRIADNEENKSYIGIYRYINPNIKNDIRTSLVLRLEEPRHAPTYNANTRFDIFSLESILDLWPSSGKLYVESSELCDFTVSKPTNPTLGTGCTLNIVRSMTKYFPSYIRDWQGLDPEAESDAVETFSPISITLADPVDISCSPTKRIAVSTTSTGIGTTSLGTGNTVYTPVGIGVTALTTVTIPSTSTSLDEDFQKFSIGDVVTIPYLSSISTGLTFTVSASTGNSGGPDSTNRAGDIIIRGTVSSNYTVNTAGREPVKYQILPNSNTNYSIYNSVNPISVVTFNSDIISVSSGSTYDLTLSNALFSNISTGASFRLVPMFKTDSPSDTSTKNNINVFKSRIVDLYKSGTNIILVLSDRFLELDSDIGSDARHYGFIVINHGGWTYPRSGAAQIRPNNIKLSDTAPSTISVGTASTMYIMNNSGRINVGDQISYSYGETSTPSTFTGYISNVEPDLNGYSKCTIIGTGSSNILHNQYSNKSQWLTLSDITIHHKSSNFDTAGPCINRYFISNNGTTLSFPDYSIWPSNYSLYFTRTRGIYSRQGIVGNFGRSLDRTLVTGFNFNRFSEIQRNNQYPGNTFWSIASLTTPWNSEIVSVGLNNGASDSLFVSSKATKLDLLNTGTRSIIPLNNTNIGITNLPSIVRTYSNIVDNNGLGALDALDYKTSFTNNIKYTVTGGITSESIRISAFTYYEPCLDLTTSSNNLTATVAYTSSNNNLTINSGTILPGDSLYYNGVYRGTVNSSRNGFIYSGSDFSGDVTVISPMRIKTATITGNVAAGSFGPNTIGNGVTGYDGYNCNFTLAERNYNSTPLINTQGQLSASSSILNTNTTNAILSGDLIKYNSSKLNVNVTYFNARIHTALPITISSAIDL